MDVQFDKVLSSDQLPSLPSVALRVVALAQQPEPDFAELVATIKTDPAICARILKTANSALFGLRQRVSSIEAAVPILGATLVRTLVLGFSLARHSSPREELADVFQQQWRRSLIQAVAAETLAAQLDSSDAAVYFVAGLLQDIGVLALLSTYPEQYSSAILVDGAFVGHFENEAKKFGFTHVDVSTELCRRWGLDDELIRSISQHHEPYTAVDPSHASARLTTTLIAATHCADYFESTRLGSTFDTADLRRIFAGQYSFDGKEIDDFFKEVLLRVGEAAATFSIDIGRMPNLVDILASAQTALTAIAMQSQLAAVAAQQQTEHALMQLQQAESQREQLRNDAYRDPLTGAYNRRFLANVLELELERCEEKGLALGILFLDIDNFKTLNDTYGHTLGDEALTKVSQILHQSVRESDLVIRYGGDEFVIVLINVSLAMLQEIATRICRQIQRASSEFEDNIALSSSVGAVFYSPRQGGVLHVDEILAEADRAMYEAKQQGGNQVQVHHLAGQRQRCEKV